MQFITWPGIGLFCLRSRLRLDDAGPNVKGTQTAKAESARRAPLLLGPDAHAAFRMSLARKGTKGLHNTAGGTTPLASTLGVFLGRDTQRPDIVGNSSGGTVNDLADLSLGLALA